MIRGMIAVDAVVHPRDLASENQNPAAAQLQAVYAVAEPCSIAMGHPFGICEMGLVTDERMTLEGVRSVKVRQTLDDLWTPDRMGCAP